MNRRSISLPDKIFLLLFIVLAAMLPVPSSLAAPKATLIFAPEERVVLIGDTLIERERLYGYVEERFTVHDPSKKIIFRNLGWSADTPAGISRVSFDFDKPGIGLERIKEQVAAIQPTLVIVGYGMASSFDGEAGVAKFKDQMHQLFDTIQQVCTNKGVRYILLTPVRHENLGAPLPDPADHNAQLLLYARAVQDLAAEKGSFYASLYHNLLGDGTKLRPPRPYTDDGIHLTAFGYLRASEAIEKCMVWEPNLWRVEITKDGKVTDGSYGTKVADLTRSADEIHFTSIDNELVSPVIHDDAGKRIPTADAPSLIQIDGLKRGNYQLFVDGALLVAASAKEWQDGVVIDQGPQFEQAEELRQAILRKNVLFFDRWRPQNETYLFGFRKHEQGKNAKEIPMFDPLVKEQEDKIAILRQPKPHTYVLKRASAGGIQKAQVNAASGTAAVESPASPDIQPLPDFEVAPGFKVTLYAENPLLAKPIQMNFDPQGRLWVVSSSVYPQIEPGQVANDKVLILEDTKGTGIADKSTIFAEGLMIPTGVEPGDGGVYVAQGTQLLHYKDTDGDGHADEKRVVLSGFGTEDTHHILHTLRWGPDGQLYFDQSIYIHSHIETPHGVERLNSGGIWHLRPPTMELGVFLKGFCNPWGHQFDAFGQSFVTDGAGYQGISFGVPGATYFTYAIMRREMQSISAGNYPKFCSLELIASKQFPDDWQGNAITCDFRAHRVVRFAIDEKDAGYVSREMPDLIRSTNVTFRPIDVKTGPDGALYIADWFNPIIQHGEVDFRDPRRDHEHGRIWRVSAVDKPLLKAPDFLKSSNKQLLDDLLSPNRYDQQQARRVLTERGVAIVPDLKKWAASRKEETAMLQALWMYESIDQVEPALLDKVLAAQDGHIRAAGTRVLGAWHARLKNPMDLLARLVTDDFPRVRLEAVRALASMPSARSAELVLSVVDKPMDPFLDYGVWLSINDLAKPWLEAVKSGEWKLAGRAKQLEFGLKAVEPVLAGEVLGQLSDNKPLARDGGGPWIELIGEAGNPSQLRRVFDQSANNGFDDGANIRALASLEGAARLRNSRPSGDLAPIGTQFSNPNPGVREAALKLAGAWKLQPLAAHVIDAVRQPGAAEGIVSAGCASLREMGGAEAVKGLGTLVADGNSPMIRRHAVAALAALSLEKAKAPAIELLNQIKDENEALELWRSLLGVKGAATALTHALPKSGLSPVMAKAGLRAAREGGRNEPDLVFALSRGADLEAEGQSLSDAEIKAMAERVLKTGNAARGQLIFRRKEIGCTSCHAIGGAGGKVGPDLTSIGASAQPDYLIESVLYPNRKIKEGFHSILIATRDDEEISGVLVRENNNQVVVRNASDREVSVAKDNIKTRTLGASLMPTGLVDGLSPADRLDLYRFLSELGKPGPYDASHGNVARVWRLFPQPVESAQFGDEKILKTPLDDPGWIRSFSLVDGELPRQELDDALKTIATRSPRAIFAAAQVQVAQTGPFHLKLEASPDAVTWIDGKAFKAGSAMTLNSGIHTVIVKLDTVRLPKTLRIETPDGTFVNN